MEAVRRAIVDVERQPSIPSCCDDVRFAGLVDDEVLGNADGGGELANEVMIGGGNTDGGQRGRERARQRVSVDQGSPLSNWYLVVQLG